MFVTRRSLYIFAPSVVIAAIWPTMTTVVLLTALMATLLGVDALLTVRRSQFHCERHVPESVRVGDQVNSTVTLTNTSGHAVTVWLRDAWPPSVQAHRADDPSRARHLDAGTRTRVTTRLSPTRRGDCHAAAVTVRVCGPLGCAGRQYSWDCPQVVRALPPFRSREHLPSRLARLQELSGRSAVLQRGAGSEFDSLREYVPGDDVRDIDWRSTARRGEVLVRTWQPERDRRVVIIIDTGRLSAARVGDAPRLDSSIEAALLLAALASSAGDKVTVAAVDSHLRTRVSGISGPQLLQALAHSCCPLTSELVDMDWATVASIVEESTVNRALVVVISALEPAGEDISTRHIMARLAHDHTLVLASVSESSLETMRQEREQDIYLAAAAERDTADILRMRAQMLHANIHTVEAPGYQLAPALADLYIDLKSTGRL